MKMFSLKHTIIAQFILVLLPLVLALGFQVSQNERRNANLEFHRQAYELALSGRDRYVTFSNGVADAVHSSVLSSSALAAFAGARYSLDKLGRQSHSQTLADTVKAMTGVAEKLEKDPTLTTLKGLRGELVALHTVVNDTKTEYERNMSEFIQRSLVESEREKLLVIGLSLVVLLMTIFFIYRTIRYLSHPLALAVSIADRIADNRDVAQGEFNMKLDMGNLIGSLQRMYNNLNTYRVDAVAYQEKIRQLAESQSSLSEAQQLANMGNWHWDVSAPLAQWSDEMCRVLGTAPGACVPEWSTYLAFVDVSEQAELSTHFHELLRVPGTKFLEHHITTRDGLYRDIHCRISSRADADGKVAHLHGTIQDITERKLAEAKMHRLAMYDTLTGLPNRQLFNEQLVQAVARADRGGEYLAVMFIDLDRFKRINDTLGHATGDALLREVSVRLNHCVRATDDVGRDAEPGVPEGRVARLAGDEFTVTLDRLREPQDAARVARRIIAEVSRPFMLGGQEVVVTTSIGIAVYPDDGAVAEILLKNADVAMYEAKSLGRNTYQFFAGEMNSAAIERLHLENELRYAMERHQLSLHYHLKVDVRTGGINGVEALMRWCHPELGMVSPVTFIPVAEDLGLIVGFGEWVLEAACRQIKAWRDAGLPPVPMAINFASPSFQQPGLAARVASALLRHGVPPAELCIEATESILMRDADATMSTLKQLRELGVKLSIDDFGTGYSSLSYLRRFPIDQLKIDRSFVSELTANNDDAAIITAIVSLARSLNLEVVAEGVETVEQAHLLLQQGCYIMQGYLFSMPLPAAELTRLLAQGAAFNQRILQVLEGSRAVRSA